MNKYSTIQFILLVLLLMSISETSVAEEPEQNKESRGVRHSRHSRGEMHPDRPELSVSSRTVRPGRVQLEVDFEVEREKGSDNNTVTAPSALLRMGLAPELELRLSSDLLVFEGAESGTSNSVAGLKWHFVRKDVSLGLLAQVGIPAGNPHFQLEGYKPMLALLADVPLGSGWEARLNVAAESSLVEGERDINALFAVALFTRLSEKLEFHTEFGRHSGVRGDSRPGPIVDAGFAYLIDEETHIDIAGFKGLSDDVYDWKFSLGFAKRF